MMKLVTALLNREAAEAAGSRLAAEGLDFTRADRDGGGVALSVRVEPQAADRICTMIAEAIRLHRRSEVDLGLLMIRDLAES
jgi:hypothetical protein